MNQSTSVKRAGRLGGLSKTGLMYASLLVFWVACILLFNPRLLSLMHSSTSIPARVSVLLFVLCIDVFWLYGGYYLMMFLFSLLARLDRRPAPFLAKDPPPVAVLYTTCNDFSLRAAVSCVEQAYGRHHVFVLDDSTDPGKIAEVDAFAGRFPDKVTVVRRGTRDGYKAGNVNSALRNYVKGYPYFALVDADGVIPPDFVAKLTPYFGLDERIAFVQGSHSPHPVQKSRFAQDLAEGILPLWTVYFPPKNKYGFVVFLGHGGIIRRDVWEQAGGFPEVVSEDLAFSTKIREMGYTGYFVPGVVSLEDFPESYAQLRKQQVKYTKGSLEYMARGFGGFARARGVKWYEKADVLFSCTSLYLPAFYLLFLFLYCLVLPAYWGIDKPLNISLPGLNVRLWTACVFRQEFKSIGTAGFYALTILTMVAPILGCLGPMLRRPAKTLRLLCLSTVPYLSLVFASFWSAFNYLFTKRAVFLVTGDRRQVGGSQGHPTRRCSLLVPELVLGLFLTAVGLRLVNLSLLALSISLILGSLVHRFGWSNRVLAPALFVPALLILGAVGTLGMGAIGLQGIFLPFFMVHF